MATQPLILSLVNPDQNDLRVQLEGYLATIDSWKGVVASQTGQGILNMVAAIGAFDQAKIRRKYQDSFPETVVSDEAGYGIAEMQGVRLTRKLPAGVGVTLTSTADLTIPAYQTFQGAGAFFFNRIAVFLAANVPTPVTLYEGRVQNLVSQGLGQEYSMYASVESGFVVSDVDVAIRLDADVMERSTGGLWTLRNKLGFQDSTLPDGKMLIHFGTATFGGIPDSNQVLYITYVTTLGADGNGLDTNTKTLTAPSFSSVKGVFTTSPTGGADERPALTYKNLAATTFGVFDSAITRQQYITTALTYPGIVDVVTFAQREVNPAALEWMNLIKIVPLTSSVWSATDKQNYCNWMQERTAYSPVFFVEDPVPLVINVDLDIYCFASASSTTAKQNAQTAIRDLLKPRAGILNYDLHYTDLVEAVMNSDPGIEYAVFRTPSSDTLISPQPMLPPSLSELAGSGTLPALTSYAYGLAVTTPGGVIAVRNFAGVSTTSANNRILIGWEAYPNAISYQLYRRAGTGGVPLLLANVTAPTLQYIDNGSVTPSGAPLPQNTVPIRYIQLGTLNIVDRYSTRSLRV